jgi:MFS family permease
MTIPETLGRALARSPEQRRTFGQTMTPWLWLVVAVVLFAGGLFGYDQGVISGALGGIKSTVTLSPLMIEAVTNWVTLGALFGSLAGGELADRFGRERTMLIAGDVLRPLQYRTAADAHLKGLERRVAVDLSPDVSSVATLFVSRWDRAVARGAGRTALGGRRSCGRLMVSRWAMLGSIGSA